MIQSLGKEVIKMADDLKAQDIYIIPEGDDYKIHMRIDGERRRIESFDGAQMPQLISHFKYLSGMNVGENVDANLAPVITNMVLKMTYRFDYQQLEIIVGRKV